MTTRRLILMRHAKAEAFAATDHVRALTDRGRRDASAAGRRLAADGLVPTHALVSTAARARETWEYVAQSSGAQAEAVVDDSLYAGGIDALHDALRGLPAGAGTAILVGHNPTVASLAHLLDDGRGDADALRRMARGYPTCAAAVLELAVPWSALEAETGRVVGFLDVAA